jgi:hypothetical protein
MCALVAKHCAQCVGILVQIIVIPSWSNDQQRTSTATAASTLGTVDSSSSSNAQQFVVQGSD